MVVTITFASPNVNTTVNKPVHITATITSDTGIKNVEWSADKDVIFTVTLDKRTLNFTPSTDGVYTFTCSVQDNNSAFYTKNVKVTCGSGTTPTPDPTPDPTPEPIPIGEVLYDSQRDTTLHDGQAGTFTKVGDISPGKLGLECRASGNPRIVKNPDKTFSLKCDAGHGRFYGFTKNYNATLVIECAFWNKVSGQDCSLRLRSRHNEPDPCSNRFGGYGFTPDYSGWGSKREICHNDHDQEVDGNLPSNPQTQQYFTVEYTVKDEADKVRQIAKYNGTTVMNRLTGRQPAPQSLFDQQSYFWVRQNIDSGTGELRIKRLRILKA